MAGANLSAGNDGSGNPYWDAAARELWLDGILVKSFHVPAPHQQAILDAFQEEGWPRHIDDPLSGACADAGKRLRKAIEGLNHQDNKFTIFSADGTGQGVRWRRA